MLKQLSFLTYKEHSFSDEEILSFLQRDERYQLLAVNELNKRNLKSKIVLQVHDEMMIEAPIEEKEQVKQIDKKICLFLKML